MTESVLRLKWWTLIFWLGLFLIFYCILTTIWATRIYLCPKRVPKAEIDMWHYVIERQMS